MRVIAQLRSLVDSIEIPHRTHQHTVGNTVKPRMEHLFVLLNYKFSYLLDGLGTRYTYVHHYFRFDFLAASSVYTVVTCTSMSTKYEYLSTLGKV